MMNDQQALIYRQWVYEGKARLVPMPERKGWYWLEVHQGQRGWVMTRALGPQNAKQVMIGGKNGSKTPLERGSE